MSAGEDTRMWHPFADMGAVRRGELVIERGDDVWVWDSDGRRYLDGTAALWYANVGHGRPEIAAAVAEQMAKLENYSTFGDFVNPPALMLAETLADLAPMPARVFFVSGGGEAIDTAAKLARRYWFELGQPERTLLISRTAGYHGTNGYGTALAGIPANRVGFGPQVETVQVPHDSLEAMEAAIEEAGAEKVAAVFAEPVIGAGGVYPPLPGYLEGLAAVCERTGVLLVADSVICGFGRLGTWFGIERWGVEPAMVIFAKGVTSGYLPLGGVLVSERVAEPFWREPGGPVFRHGPTYSGHATVCAAALANLALLEREGLIARGRELEGRLLEAFTACADHPAVAEVRGGVGLLAALALTDETLERHPDAVMRVVMGAREAGVLVRPLGRAVAASPPLTLGEEHFELISEALARGLAALG
jgi:adenosylmethionine-8-amino-7-oxononanoate aminotransferase